jgi:glycerophosphoryl diester phosphodiesterase
LQWSILLFLPPATRFTASSSFVIAQLCTRIMNGFGAMIQARPGAGQVAKKELAAGDARFGPMKGTRSNMSFSFLAREAGRVHVCGHRGYSLHYPENTLPAFQAAKAWGATIVEIDVVLTADGELIVLHDLTVDRTTDGHGFAADLSLERIRSLDAGSGFSPRFAGIRIPTLAEVLDWAKSEEMGLLLEIKDTERPDLAVDRVASLLAATGTVDRAVVISFDHVVLKRAVERHSGIRTQAITHARHADIVGVLRACGASSVSIELDMFHPDDGRTLRAAGWRVVGTGDFTGTGTSDVLLQNGGTIVDWIMQNGHYQSGNVLTTAAAGWTVVGTGDYNGDGTSDILLQNGGTVVDWTMKNGAFQSGNVIANGAAGFHVVKT